MCFTRLAENTGCKNSPSAHHGTNLSGYIFATKASIDNRKNLLNSDISATHFQNIMNFCPLTAEICWRVWGTSANFNGFRVLASLLHPCRSTEVNQSLHDVWPSPGLAHHVYTFGGGLLPPNGILPGAKFALRPSLAFSYNGSGRPTARHLLNSIQQMAPPIFGGWPWRWALTLAHFVVFFLF